MSDLPVHTTGLEWRLDDMPDQTGRTALVTGTTIGGIGHHTALELARRGARVVLAGRSVDKLAATRAAILEQAPHATLDELSIDLSDLTSVRQAAAQAESVGAIDVLVNNAGVMATPFRRTQDGIEQQMATNHFGPFLLTGLLLPQLTASGDGRVVAVSSQFHRMARSAPVDDPRSQSGRYLRWPTYARSKLANLLVTYELERRCRVAGLPVRGLAAHPGFSGTHLAVNGRYGGTRGGRAAILDAAVKGMSQSAAAGAWPTLMAATADLPGGTYCGPSGLGEMGGYPMVVTSSRLSRDEAAARRLWEVSERAVGLSWP